MKRITIGTFLLLSIFLSVLTGCSQSEEEAGDKDAAERAGGAARIAVVVPGVTAGSPIYENMVTGAGEALEAFDGASMKVVELGFNQSEWSEKLTSLVSQGEYDYVLTSNPAMPFICLEVAESFPEQKFLILDAYYADHPQMATFLYNQVEQSYMLGHLAGLLSRGAAPGTNEELKIGLVVAQEYPALNKMIKPGFLEGAQAVDPGFTLDFRVIGNWFDAGKAAELTTSMIDAGVDVIGAVCGGAAQGVIDAARERGRYVMFWDHDEYDKGPGVIAGCGALHQTRLAREVVTAALKGETAWGKARILTAREGYIEFVTDNPLYSETVPEAIRAEQQEVIHAIEGGELLLEVPEL